MNVMKYMTPTGTHRDGGPFGISLESLAAQGVSLETGALCDVIPTKSHTNQFCNFFHTVVCVTSSWYFGAQPSRKPQ